MQLYDKNSGTYFLITLYLIRCDNKAQTPLHGHRLRTPTTDMLYNTTNRHHQRTSSQQFYNKFAPSQWQSLTSRHVKMLECGELLSVGGDFVVQQVVELLWARPLVVSVAGVRVAEFGTNRVCFAADVHRRTARGDAGLPGSKPRLRSLERLPSRHHRRHVVSWRGVGGSLPLPLGPLPHSERRSRHQYVLLAGHVSVNPDCVKSCWFLGRFLSVFGQQQSVAEEGDRDLRAFTGGWDRAERQFGFPRLSRKRNKKLKRIKRKV